MPKKKWKKQIELWEPYLDTVVGEGAKTEIDRVKRKQNRRVKRQIDQMKKKKLW
jgi:hypothetical protein